MGNNVFLSEEGLDQFNKAIRLLDASIQEFSNIADQMVPQTLLDSGLDQYLREFSLFLTSNHQIKINYHSTLHNYQPDEKVSVTLFRCFRTIIYILLKHADATRLDIDLTVTEHNIRLVLKDNGNIAFFGLDKIEIIKGLQNIKQLLQENEGELSFQRSAEGNLSTITLSLASSC